MNGEKPDIFGSTEFVKSSTFIDGDPALLVSYFIDSEMSGKAHPEDVQGRSPAASPNSHQLRIRPHRLIRHCDPKVHVDDLTDPGYAVSLPQLQLGGTGEDFCSRGACSIGDWYGVGIQI